MFSADNLAVGLVSTHIPLRAVPDYVTHKHNGLARKLAYFALRDSVPAGTGPAGALPGTSGRPA